MTQPTNRKPRKKATTDLGRSILQRQRQRLAREQAALAEKHASDAARIRSMKKKAIRHAGDADSKANAAIGRSIVRNLAGVLASEGVNVPIHTVVIDENDSIDAWTDFQQIHVGYHLFEDPRMTAAVLRALVYHEGGHCRHTLPFPELVSQADVAVRAIFEGGDEEGATLITNRVATFKKIELQHAWNCLEDQRMETAVVSDSPRKAGYLTPMILRELCDTPDNAAANYPLLVWRRYLPSRIRKASKASFVERHGDKGAGYVARFGDIITRYVLGTDALTLYLAVLDMADMLKEVRLAKDPGDLGHKHQYRRGYGQPKPDLNIPIDPSMEEDEVEGEGVPQPGEGQGRSELIPPTPKPTPGAGTPTPDASDEQGAPSKGASKDDDHTDDFDNDDTYPSVDDDEDADDDAEEDAPPQSSAGTSGKHESDDEGLTQEALDKAIADAEAERNKDAALDKDVAAYHDAQDTISSTLEGYVGGISTNAGDIALARNLADDMARSFEVATQDKAPAWFEGQKRGILNPIRYKTRQAGDVEFFRNYVDEGDPGFDLSVSVLLDYSGSMGGVTTELAQVAFASKLACQKLGIPCTVVLWDTSARLLWDATETAEVLPLISPAGGTDPGVALADLDNHVLGKSKHVVLIMTDDDWSGSAPSLSSFQQEGRTIIGLGYGSYGSPASIVKSMEQKGADQAFALESLLDLPRYLEQALIMSA